MAEERKCSDKSSTHEAESRWSSYGNYRLFVWIWMMNEIAVMFSPSEISHNGFYFQAMVQTLGVIFIGIPLVYSEIVLAQYTNCDLLTMWNFFPVFRAVGYGTIYLIILKTIYLMVLASWYLMYTFHSALDPPPWFSCDSFPNEKCMVKSINVSIFQHCLEALNMFGVDCGMQTASSCFFYREIGYNSTADKGNCFFTWKAVIACSVISCALFIISMKKEKFMTAVVKLFIFYMCCVTIVLFGVALSSNGTWFASTIGAYWNLVHVTNSMNSLINGMLSLGTGCGMIVFISRDAPFRSPAMMTAVATSLFSHAFSMLLAFIIFSGIKTMSYFHGEEEYIIEVADTIYFTEFASITEIMTYFKTYVWGFLWFSGIAFSLFCNIWILHLYLGDMMFEYRTARKYKKLAGAMLLLCISCLSWPFFCSDLTGALTDATELIQIMNNLLFSISLYWIYGYNNHSVDIIFMIGVKSSYFWKITWLCNPVMVAILLYFRYNDLEMSTSYESYEFSILPLSLDWVLLYILLGLYGLILVIGMILQIIKYYRKGNIRGAFAPTHYWGPCNMILFKSRKMFVPEIMTTEFLYRQVKIYGYYDKKSPSNKQSDQCQDTDEFDVEMETEWSPMTSN